MSKHFLCFIFTKILSIVFRRCCTSIFEGATVLWGGGTVFWGGHRWPGGPPVASDEKRYIYIYIYICIYLVSTGQSINWTHVCNIQSIHCSQYFDRHNCLLTWLNLERYCDTVCDMFLERNHINSCCLCWEWIHKKYTVWIGTQQHQNITPLSANSSQWLYVHHYFSWTLWVDHKWRYPTRSSHTHCLLSSPLNRYCRDDALHKDYWRQFDIKILCNASREPRIWTENSWNVIPTRLISIWFRRIFTVSRKIILPASHCLNWYAKIGILKA